MDAGERSATMVRGRAIYDRWVDDFPGGYDRWLDDGSSLPDPPRQELVRTYDYFLDDRYMGLPLPKLDNTSACAGSIAPPPKSVNTDRDPTPQDQIIAESWAAIP